jgi:pimeloyl-ACP methyl ester carboxylesterase
VIVPDFAPGSVEERRITAADGVGLAVRLRNREGPQPAVLLVHGLSSNARTWEGVAEDLAGAGHPVAALDQRGHGRSDKPDGGYDFATLAGDLLTVLDDLGWRHPVLVAGQGWGGNVVLEAAARHPGRVAAVALIDGGTTELSTRFADWPTCEVALTPPDLDGRPLAWAERRLRLQHADWPDTGIAGALADLEVLGDGTVRPWLSPSHRRRILRALWEHHPPERYARLACPVLLVPAGDPTTKAARFDLAQREEIGRAEAELAVSVTRWIDGDPELHAEHPDLVAALLHAAATGSLWDAPGGTEEAEAGGR